MVDCLTVAAGILACSQGVIKGTGADQRFVKNALKICVLPPAYYKYFLLSYFCHIYERLPSQIRIVQKKNQQSLLTHHQGNVIIRIIPIGKL